MTTTNTPWLTIGVLESGIEFTVEGEAAIAALPADESEVFELFRSITVRRIATDPASFEQATAQEIGTTMTTKPNAVIERTVAMTLEAVEAGNKANYREGIAERQRHARLKKTQQAIASPIGSDHE